MDIILSNSRGRYMEEYIKKLHPCPEKLFVISKSGGQLKDLLYKNLPNLLKNVPKYERPEYHVYFLAGICDITYRELDHKFIYNPLNNCFDSYDEVIFMESPAEANLRLYEIVKEVSDGVTKLGARPCFSTIVPCSLAVWNHQRLNQGKTSCLLHSEHYDDMQSLMMDTIVEINRDLKAINTQNEMCTPYIASTVIENLGQKKYRVHYSRLPDGTHPTITLAKTWAKKLCAPSVKIVAGHSSKMMWQIIYCNSL